MTLQANRMRSIIILSISFFIGVITVVPFTLGYFDGLFGTLLPVYMIVGMGMGTFFGICIPFIIGLSTNNNIVLDENTLTALCTTTGFLLPRTVTVNISDIDLSKSKFIFLSSAALITKKGDRLFLSYMYHSRKDVRKLFDEIERLQSIQNG